MKRLFYRLTGGRPMVRGRFRFHNSFNGKAVYEYRDAYGREWLATSAWDYLRVDRLECDPSESEIEALLKARRDKTTL